MLVGAIASSVSDYSRTLNNDKPGHSLVEKLDLKGDRYNFVVAIFFLPYVLFEFPSNIA